jgi:uridine kinase
MKSTKPRDRHQVPAQLQNRVYAPEVEETLERSVAHGKPFIIGVAGGTGSGKTTVSQRICQSVDRGKIAYLQHDSYYHDLSHLAPEARSRRNYDHPASLDTPLLIEHIHSLRQGESIQSPIYDFATHTRRAETICIPAAQIILVEGILILAEPTLRELLDMRIFVDTDADIRFIRRMQRDLRERGRTIDSIVQQYQATVRPMHLEFVEPSKRYAHVIVPEGGNNQVAMEMIISRIHAVLATPSMQWSSHDRAKAL